FYLTFGGGSTKKARNAQGDTVPLLDIYGLNKMQNLGVNVPNKDVNNPLDLILIQLAQLPTRDDFATFSIHGKFSILEANLFFYQNLVRGFFFHFHLPIRKLKIKNVNFEDLSPTDQIIPNINSPEWQRFLMFFDAILKRYNLSREPTKEKGVGDLTAWLGW